MSKDNHDLHSIWRDQPISVTRLTPEQLRSRAQQFQSQMRRRNIRDYICAGIVALWCGITAALGNGVLVQTGSFLMMLWGMYFIYGQNRFGSARVVSSNWSTESCTAFHRHELTRQRDLALSRPWGIALLLPGMVLFSVGIQMAGKQPDNWQPSILMISLFVFVAIATVIDGKLIAHKLQREIDALAG